MSCDTAHANLPSIQLRRRIDSLYFFDDPGIYCHCTTVTVLDQAVSCLEEGDSVQFSPAFSHKFSQLYGGLLNLPTTLPRSILGNIICVIFSSQFLVDFSYTHLGGAQISQIYKRRLSFEYRQAQQSN